MDGARRYIAPSVYLSLNRFGASFLETGSVHLGGFLFYFLFLSISEEYC